MKNIELLTLEDLSFIKESLKYTKLKFEEYQTYPSYEYKQKRIQEAAEVLNKVSDIIKANRKSKAVYMSSQSEIAVLATIHQ